MPFLLLLTALAGTFPVGASAVAHHQPQLTIRPAVVGDPLTPPSVLANESREPHTVEVTLTAAVARLALRPGVETEVFAYNGQVPGPTLEVWEGDRVIVHFKNELPEPTTIHWHGIHIPAPCRWQSARSRAARREARLRLHGRPRVPPAPTGIILIPTNAPAPEVAMGLYGAIIVRAAA